MGRAHFALLDEAPNSMNCKPMLSCRARTRRTALPDGFTLMELLIVIAIILILMLMAIPTVGHLKKMANETSAINSMQVITKAELSYSNTYPVNGYACTLTAMGGDPASGAPTAAAAQILQQDLVSGYKSGYIFSVACKEKVTVNGVDRYNGYTVTAVPQTVGKTGDRGFCEGDSGTITFDPAGGTNCTQPLSQ
ncbi:MAG: prepilin-type N-terminal cleavage/methylation domain-containing protein [Terracidiphilus sp.]|jgi:type IV pilus assembly protein PilA